MDLNITMALRLAQRSVPVLIVAIGLDRRNRTGFWSL
jgi:hypothetical protein